MKPLLISLTLLAILSHAYAEEDKLPIQGFSIAAPSPENFERFLEFTENEIAPRGINTLVLRIDYRYEYESHPELRSPNPLSKEQVKRLVSLARDKHIRLIPQINLLGHQSWASTLGRLLTVYPEFDETPHVKLPVEYKWPNPDGLYCKSYCTLHTDVHEIVFAMVDEITEVFETDAFHAGLDEVFYIGDDQCPRCSGKDKSELFAGEVTKIRNHLAQSGKELWMWGDRLIDAKTTHMGMWEASDNDTHRAIDMIPTDVVICDWHYERVAITPAFFALKGLRVVASPWDKPDQAIQQREQMKRFRANANPQLASRFQGMLHTYWSSAATFMDIYYGDAEGSEKHRGSVETLRRLFPKPGENTAE